MTYKGDAAQIEYSDEEAGSSQDACKCLITSVTHDTKLHENNMKETH
jgi:hypothetical protein